MSVNAPEEGQATPSVEEMLQQILADQQAHRAEVAELRAKIDAQKSPAPAQSASAQSAEELYAARMEDVKAHSHYCPGCGTLSHFIRQCFGRPEAPHPPIDMIPTDELTSDDTSQHTAAPNTDHLG